MNKPLLLLGGGGHAGVLLDILRMGKKSILGFSAPEFDFCREAFFGISRLKNDQEILLHDKEKVRLVNGIGSLPGQTARFLRYEYFTSLGYSFESVIASSAIVSPYAQLGTGVQILQGAIVQAGAVVGDNTIVNSGVIIEHDCVIGPHNHLAPGVVMSGGVETGAYVHVGSGACIIQCIEIGEKAVIGAGAVVKNQVPAGNTVYPARTTTIMNKGR